MPHSNKHTINRLKSSILVCCVVFFFTHKVDQLFDHATYHLVTAALHTYIASFHVLRPISFLHSFISFHFSSFGMLKDCVSHVE